MLVGTDVLASYKKPMMKTYDSSHRNRKGTLSVTEIHYLIMSPDVTKSQGCFFFFLKKVVFGHDITMCVELPIMKLIA